MKRKTTSLLVILCMVLAMLPVSTFPVYAAGGLTVTGGVLNTDYTYEGDVLTIKTAVPMSIANIAAATTDRIVVESGITANITLNDVDIDASAISGACAFDMTGATVNLTLTGDNILKSGWDYAGLQVPSGAVLTIGGTGSLSATGGYTAAGIGGGDEGAAGTITINSGTVHAIGSHRSAGIGGGNTGAGGTITISGGTVDARGDSAPGIGGGYKGAGGTININGGNVTATGGHVAAGIGTGYQGASGTITISGGTVTAIGGDNGAGIGGGKDNSGGTINISGVAIVTAAGGSFAPGIGTGSFGDPWLITIASPAHIKALGQTNAPAIQSVSVCSAYILMANFTSDKGSGIKTEIRTSAGAILDPAIEWTPSGGYWSMAFTIPSDITTYTVYTDGAKQQYTNGATTSNEFAITGAGLSTFHAVTVAQAAPTATVQSITGTTQVGQTLTGHYSYSDVNGDLEGTSTFKWYRSDDASGINKEAIATATATTYLLQAADLGKYISFEVTPVALAGTTTGVAVESARTVAITAAQAAPTSSGGGSSSTATTVIKTNTGSVTGAQLKNAADVAKDGETVTIKSEKSSEVNFPTSGLGSLTGKNNSLTVVTDNGTLTFDSKAVGSIGTQAAATDIKVIVDDVVKTTLTEDQQTKVGDKMVYDLTVMSGGKLISSFNGGKVTVSIPYDLKTGETAENLTVWYMADDGTLTEINCTYDTKSKSVTFVVDHFSKYLIGYDELADWVNPFTDVKSSAWYYNAAAFVNVNGLMKGQTDTDFGPQGAMTRGMFVTILGRMEGVDATTYADKNTFSDVKSSQYYAPYIAWASDKGIVTGMGGDQFAPNAAVTREQMAVMMTNYMKFKGQGPTGAWAIPLTYGDLDKVSSWADEGVMFMTMKDLMKGMGNDTKGNPLFAPKATSTRAQTAQVMMNLEELLK